MDRKTRAEHRQAALQAEGDISVRPVPAEVLGLDVEDLDMSNRHPFKSESQVPG